MKVISPETPWIGRHRDRSPTQGFDATREAAMAARSW
jgi:hypothetical protein